MKLFSVLAALVMLTFVGQASACPLALARATSYDACQTAHAAVQHVTVRTIRTTVTQPPPIVTEEIMDERVERVERAERAADFGYSNAAAFRGRAIGFGGRAVRDIRGLDAPFVEVDPVTGLPVEVVPVPVGGFGGGRFIGNRFRGRGVGPRIGPRPRRVRR